MVTQRIRTNALRLYLLALAASLFAFGSFAIAQKQPAAKTAQPGIVADDSKACLECHVEPQGKAKAIDPKAIKTSPHKEFNCQDCHTTITDAPHSPEMIAEKPSCGSCHSEQNEGYLKSAHGKPDRVEGDHPKCVTCHGNGNPHAVRPAKEMSRPDKAVLCSGCHRQDERMVRYGVDTEAVISYEESFHGKALLRFNAKNTAICTDCHSAHAMLSPNDPRAPTNRKNAQALCSQAGCHTGSKLTFAMSGANHLRLKIRDDAILRSVDIFFKFLVGSVVVFLCLGVVLDLRKKVFGPTEPRGGRGPGLIISVSFLCSAVALVFALNRNGMAASWLFGTSFGLALLAYGVYFIAPPAHRKNGQKYYPRLTKVQRAQHISLMLCFLTLIFTGLPLRFATVPWLRELYSAIGGIAVARPIHRIAALGLICVWSWHMVHLVIKWRRSGFAMKSLTMLPNKKDLEDFFAMSLCYLGLSNKEPEMDRFGFKQKLDYLAEYWGVPVMVLSGFVLWFPIYWGNKLPEEALSIALVAHGLEATLAFLAIVMWHIYNENFDPETFPLNPVWLTGKMSREQMEREHPLELRRLEGPDNPEGGPA